MDTYSAGDRLPMAGNPTISHADVADYDGRYRTCSLSAYNDCHRRMS